MTIEQGTAAPEAPTCAIAEYNETAAALARLAKEYKGIVFPVETRDGMALAIKGRAELRGYRVALEKKRKELKAPALERSRLIDAEAQRITAEIVALESPIDEAIKSEEGRRDRERAEKEQAERERIQRVQDAIAALAGRPTAVVGKPSAEIAAVLEETRVYVIGAWAFEFAQTAAETKGRVIATLEQLLAGAIAQETAAAAEAQRIADEKAELARLRAAQEDRDRADAVKRAAEEKAAAEAKAAREAEERASRERIAAEEKAAKEARDKADREAQEKRDAEQRIADAKRAAEIAEQTKRDAAAKEARDKIDADRREVERLQAELLDGDAMLAKFVDRFGKRKEYAGIVKAIRTYQARDVLP
jgi:colicin import membrane protein